MRDERAGAPAPFDQAFARETAQGLVHGRSGAAIFDHKLMLERDTRARRPFARADARLDIAADSRLDRHAASSRARVAA